MTDVVCEQCGRHMVIKYGPHGRFLACPGFPECRNTKPYFEKIGVACPKCGKDIVLKKTKKGRKYYGCENNPDCDFMSWQKPSKVPCPQCGGYMVEKGNKLVCADEQCHAVETGNQFPPSFSRFYLVHFPKLRFSEHVPPASGLTLRSISPRVQLP